MEIYYLHGFASGPQSFKGLYFQDKIKQVFKKNIHLLDLNIPTFEQTSLSEQYNEIKKSINSPSILIGSSMGAFLSLLLEKDLRHQIKGMVLLSPALNLYNQFTSKLSETQLEQWKADGSFKFEHYSLKKTLPLNYQFLQDLKNYHSFTTEIETPSLCFHGIHDEVIPVEIVRTFFSEQTHVSTYYLNDDHSLTNTLPTIWNHVNNYLKSRV